MAEEWKQYASAAFDIFKDSLKGFVENEQVDEFAKERLEQYAKEMWLANTADSDTKRKEHEANLKHLTAQARGEARRLEVALPDHAKEAVGSVLEVVGKMLLKLLPMLVASI